MQAIIADLGGSKLPNPTRRSGGSTQAKLSDRHTYRTVCPLPFRQNYHWGHPHWRYNHRQICYYYRVRVDNNNFIPYLTTNVCSNFVNWSRWYRTNKTRRLRQSQAIWNRVKLYSYLPAQSMSKTAQTEQFILTSKYRALHKACQTREHSSIFVTLAPGKYEYSHSEYEEKYVFVWHTLCWTRYHW